MNTNRRGGNRLQALTAREREVVELMAERPSNAAIADHAVGD
jgi:DNA-binding CsgD family transcriptional regulator